MIALAIVMGILSVSMPYTSHIKVPKVKNPYIIADIPEVSLVLMVFMAWGKKDIVVQHAATMAILMILSINKDREKQSIPLIYSTKAGIFRTNVFLYRIGAWATFN